MSREADHRALEKVDQHGKGEKPEISHVLDLTAAGTRDEVWIPRISREAWTVLTVDGGRTPNKLRGEKLPSLCARMAVTHVILSPAVHMRTSFEKLLTILSVWYELIALAEDRDGRGNRYLLEPMQRGHGRLVGRTIPPELLRQREESLREAPPPPDEFDDPT